MARIRPFKAIRPVRDKVSLVATRSYLTYSDETIAEKLNHNPYTFLHIINPDYQSNTKISGINKFNLVKKRFNQFIKEGVLKRDKSASYYIYQKHNGINKFTGIIAACAVDDYIEDKIKKHEQTLSKREKMFCKYLDTTGFNAEPVLLSHETNEEIKNILKEYKKKRPEYEFTTTNKSLHKLWIVNDQSDIREITNSFKKIENLYIADGHHRCASSALLSQTNNNRRYFMSYLIDENQLKILNFNRLIKNINSLTANVFLEKIQEKYDVIKKEKYYSPTLKNEISMYLEKTWYSLTAKRENYNTISDSLDPSILSNNILKPILNIIDERTDENIVFIDGRTTLSEIQEKVDNEEYTTAFILKPITIKSIKEVANNNEVLPPKSTYVEPKLRSGLTIYPIE